jgi:hypothetical protein
MNANIQAALSGIGITDAFQTVGEYQIYVEWQDGFQTVDFRIVESTNGYFQFHQSHFFKFPGDIDHYQTSLVTAPTEAEALRLGVQSVMTNYNLARGRGLAPQSNWFVSNPRY